MEGFNLHGRIVFDMHEKFIVCGRCGASIDVSHCETFGEVDWLGKMHQEMMHVTHRLAPAYRLVPDEMARDDDA